MEKEFYDERTGMWYELKGDYYYPCVKLPNEGVTYNINRFGRMRRDYLLNHHRVKYYNLLTDCKLHEHLQDVSEEAQRMYDMLVDQMSEQEGVTVELKANDMMKWVRMKNNICNRAMEIVKDEIVYGK